MVCRRASFNFPTVSEAKSLAESFEISVTILLEFADELINVENNSIHRLLFQSLEEEEKEIIFETISHL